MRSESEKPIRETHFTRNNGRVSYPPNGQLCQWLDGFLLTELRALRFRGTFAPFFRASDRPIAIACFRLFTVLPLLPDLSVPFFLRRIALSTRLEAALPYFRLPEGFRVAILVLRFDALVSGPGPTGA